MLRQHRIDGEALLTLDLSEIQDCGVAWEHAKKVEIAIEELKTPHQPLANNSFSCLVYSSRPADQPIWHYEL
jgi:hypothetical protein